MALERSSVTMSCIKSYVANPKVERELANTVIRAVLAIICYNVSNLLRPIGRTLSTSLDYDT
jgi:hypothetical protein